MGQVVLITGCRSGFGLLAAVEAARRGHTVYAGMRDVATDAELRAAAAVLGDGASRVIPIALDVNDAGQRRAAVERILDEQGRIDALVNNAGIALGGFLELVDEDELRQVMETNLFAAWAMTREVLPAMRIRRTGTIVMVSSMSGRTGIPGLGAYAASKWALEGLSEAWRHELALFGIKLALIEPASYRTDIFGRNRRLARRALEDGPWAEYARRMEETAQRIVDRSAGDPREVSDRIVDVIEAKRTPLRHPMGPNAALREAAQRVLPFWVTEKIMARMLKG